MSDTLVPSPTIPLPIAYINGTTVPMFNIINADEVKALRPEFSDRECAMLASWMFCYGGRFPLTFKNMDRKVEAFRSHRKMVAEQFAARRAQYVDEAGRTWTVGGQI